jgi:TonB family protein
MKHLTTLLTLLLACSSSQMVRAQSTDPWGKFSPAGEQFTVQLPKSREVKSEQKSLEHFNFAARIYTATSDGVDYTVWSLVNENYQSNGALDNDTYLDACADLVWQSLLKPLRDLVPKSPLLRSYMAYQGELESSTAPGREYTIMLGEQPGVTHIYVAGQQIYVLTALNADANSAATLRFMSSFSLRGLSVTVTIEGDPKVMPPATSVAPGRGGGVGRGENPGVGIGTGGGVGPGPGSNPGADQNIGGGKSTTAASDDPDYNRVFSGRDVTQKARVLSKPEPQYTESARRYAVQGTVILRAVFSAAGEVISIKVVKRLPHGLTQEAIAAARQIRFTPASRDGHAVSMYIQLEYNFNLY